MMDKHATFNNNVPFKKTIIVLDHKPHFSAPSKIFIDLDGGARSRSGPKSNTQSTPIFKSIWTAMVEAAVEYSRVVYDLFPCQNLVRLLVSDVSSNFVNSWSDKDQCVSQILKPLAALNSNALCETDDELLLSYSLQEALNSFLDAASQKKRNNDNDYKGRIICLTSITCEEQIGQMVDHIIRAFKTITESSKSNSLPLLHFVDVIFIHIPTVDSLKLIERAFKPTAYLSITIQTVKPSQLLPRMTSLVQRHFNLKSTIVTGIPMKEEQHSGGAINYDVELYHISEVHFELDMFNIYCTDISGPCEVSQRQEILKDTVTLKWCTTPKTSNNMDLQHCIGTFRFTVAKVNSRPAACLVTFLLQGRNVLLEQPKKTGNKVISHFLTSHGGDLYIHCLGNNRCPLEDPPSISEGCGGRVTDYRITDFGEFMKANRLAPASGPKTKGVVHLDKALARLERCTRMWPMVISDTLLFNLSSELEPLSTLIFKEHLSDDDVAECKQVITRLQAMESRNDALPISSVGFRGKGPKRDEQYRQLWVEMETFLQTTASTSKMHAKIYNYLRGETGNVDEIDNEANGILPEIEEAAKTSQAWKELDNYRNMTERERSDFLSGDKNNDHFYKRNQAQPVDDKPTIKKSKADNTNGAFPRLTYKTDGSKASLLSIWCNRLDVIAASRHEEFEGRVSSSGNQADLYTDMNADNNGESTRNNTV